MKKKNLVFMGDSLTAGVYSDGMLDYNRDGYPDFIRYEFERRGCMGTFYNIAVSGFTSKDVLDVLKADLTYNENIAYNITPEFTYRRLNYKKKNSIKLLKEDIKISKIISQADMIIMTLGSNDIIKYVDAYKGNLKNLEIRGVIKSEEQFVDDFLSVILDNFKEIFSKIRSINKKTKIIVIGSYTPHRSNLIYKLLDKHINLIENKMFKGIESFDDNVISLRIRNMVAENKKEFLDNVLDIHLNQLGYINVAKMFIEEYFQENITVDEIRYLPNKMNKDKN